MNQDIFTFPFGQIGEALRTLSLASAAGNIAATAIYLFISIAPVLYLVYRVARQKKEPDAIDILLIMMSVMLFIMMYFMVNPGYINSGLYGAMPGKGAALAMTFWSMAVGYAVLKCMKASAGTDEKKLTKYLKMILIAVAAVISINMILGIFTEVIPAARGVKEIDQQLNSDYNTALFLWIKYFADKVPSVLNIVVIIHGVKMVDQLRLDRYSQATIAAAENLSRICRISVTVMILTSIAVNLFQFLVWTKVYKTSYVVDIPLLSIVLCIAVLLLAKFFASDKAMKEDHDMII